MDKSEHYLVKVPSRIFVREDEHGHLQFVHVPEQWVAYAEMYARINGIPSKDTSDA